MRTRTCRRYSHSHIVNKVCCANTHEPDMFRLAWIPSEGPTPAIKPQVNPKDVDESMKYSKILLYPISSPEKANQMSQLFNSHKVTTSK